jgi:hypothetical protein
MRKKEFDESDGGLRIVMCWFCGRHRSRVRTSWRHECMPPFLGAFAKLRKATISFVISVRLPVRMEQLGSHWTDFHEI